MSTLQASPAAWARLERYDGIDTGATAALTERRNRTVLAKRTPPADWLPEALNTVDEMRSLQEDWDSYGARPVNFDSIRFSKGYIERLSEIQNIEMPTVTATPDGDVAFCWDAGKWSLDVSIDPSGLISYVYLDEENPDEDRETRTREVEELFPLLTQRCS